MSDRQYQYIEVSFWTMLKAALLVIILWALWILRDIVAVILISIVIASAIEPLNHWFARYRVPRVLGVIFIYLTGFLVFAAIIYLMIPPLFGDVLTFFSSLPAFIESLLGKKSILYDIFPEVPSALAALIQSFAVSLEGAASTISGGLFSAGSSIFGGVLSFIMLIVISFYLSVQEHGVENFLRMVTSLKHEAYILDLWKRSQRKIGKWLQGQLLLGALVGVIVFLGLTILDVKYAILLAILTAIFEIIPVFGPIMAAIPAIAIAFVQGPSVALMVLLLYVLVQQFENHLIYPLVVRKTIGVPPLLVVISLVVGAELGGFYGIILAVPISAVLVEYLNDVAMKKQPKVQ
ncbi:MAG: hypothetical protein UW30_C0005G0022 [Candidatus Giovannonibacteria bacterium GW2011_GWA2_44_13b]|uniref:Permease n=2 Tax=Candidatus Giovannoniibacteriota TaxID=1752738 RepID=A0A0G1H5E6_9BACT|nr:MAG: hypothetical protein UW30_C0005G0022 [Candidatus Giovannonibacteria bacterium GW2011_GWA2_44_13b]